MELRFKNINTRLAQGFQSPHKTQISGPTATGYSYINDIYGLGNLKYERFC